MPTSTLNLTPSPVQAGLLAEPQVCYALLTISASGEAQPHPVNWVLVADASRSMRIPIVDEQQFRELVRQGGAQETLVDGVPVWQLSGPVPPAVRAASRSALDHVMHALATVVERLDARDQFALIVCAEEALLLVSSTSGAERHALARGVARLGGLNLGTQTDLSRGLAMALQELRRGRDGQRVERLLLLTDGFTQQPDECLRLADALAAEGAAISTVGLGGEFQETLLTALADRSGGRALFLAHPQDIAQAVGQELEQARSIAIRAARLSVEPEPGAELRRVTRIRPALGALFAGPGRAGPLPLGDLTARASLVLLLEFLVAPRGPGQWPLARVWLSSEGATLAGAQFDVAYRAGPPSLPEPVRAAAARASVLRLHERALAAANGGAPQEAARLLRTVADRLDALGEAHLAAAARDQAATLERTGQTRPLALKELTYATRRLGEQ